MADEVEIVLIPVIPLGKKRILSYCPRCTTHRVRLALVGADKNHFNFPPGPPPTLNFHRGASHPSVLELPVIPR